MFDPRTIAGPMSSRKTVCSAHSNTAGLSASLAEASRRPSGESASPRVVEGTCKPEPFVKLRMTKLYNLMQDPFERAVITSNTYWDWIMNHVPQVYQGMEGVTDFLVSFKEFPPRSVPPSFNPANMLEDTLREMAAKQKLERAFPMLAPQQVGAEKSPN